MTYTSETVATLIGARIIGSPITHITWLLTDSRSLAFPSTTLFFALVTPHGDGHRYIDELYQRGVRTFVVSQEPVAALVRYAEAVFLLVPDTLRALQRLAERHRDAFNIPIIGITGSNGKTIVKEWIYQVLSSCKEVVRSPRSYNSQIGVPLSVWLLGAQTEVGIFEAGISQTEEMEALRTIIQPTIGIMTNIGEAHQENFTCMEQKCFEKLTLFRDAEVIIYNGDDPLVSDCVGRSMVGANLLAWSYTNDECPLYLTSRTTQDNDTTITYSYLGYDGTFTIPFTDEASIQNAIHVLATCLYLRVPQQRIANNMQRLTPIAMRLEVKQGIHGCTIINDSYNADIDSLDIALDFANRRATTDALPPVLILSDLVQTGLSPLVLYKRVAQMLRGRGITRIIGVGPQLSAHAYLFEGQVQTFITTQELLQSTLLDTLNRATVLLKGAHSYRFEEVCERLELKVHETILEVDLNALVENLNYYRSHLKPGVKLTAMVKASAYGTGAIQVAQTLQEHRVEYLAVAVADEGAQLRKAGITSNIIVMNPEMSSFRTLFKYSLEPEVYNFALLEALINAAEMQGITYYPIHIKLDTGMHRLGFDPLHDMDKLVHRLRHQTAVIPSSIFSHFAGSDSEALDAYSTQQFDLFMQATNRFCTAFEHPILRHICNSAGLLRFPDRQLDMGRLGLGLYGIDPVNNKLLHPVSTLQTTLLQIRELPAGSSVGYSRNTILQRDSRIAALPIGYADGLNRHLGNGGGYCLVNGLPATYVGNICMDVCMIDVTDITCQEGDKAIIFGPGLPVTTIAHWLDTIPYEVLTGISERVKRIYFTE